MNSKCIGLKRIKFEITGMYCLLISFAESGLKRIPEIKACPFAFDDLWSPSSDAFDILELANVSKNDALKHSEGVYTLLEREWNSA